MLDYGRLKNLVVIVLAVAFFAGTVLGEGLKLSVLANHVTRLSKRFFGVPDSGRRHLHLAFQAG